MFGLNLAKNDAIHPKWPILLIYYESVVLDRRELDFFGRMARNFRKLRKSDEKSTIFSAKRPFLKVFSGKKRFFFDPWGSVATREGPETSGGLTCIG